MEQLIALYHGFGVALTFSNLILCIAGVSIGMLVGVLPGIGPVAGTALLVPLTFGMGPIPAIIMLSGIFYGAMYGGTITSVLINVPGESASVVTCIDGYQMAKQGRGGVALGIAAIGSFVGGVVAVLSLTFLGPVLARFALRFGPPEFFSLMLFGLLLIVGLMGKSILKGLIAAITGLTLSLAGMDLASGTIRYSFDIPSLYSGFDFVVMAMGLFGISEILLNAESDLNLTRPEKIGGVFPRKDEMKATFMAILRGTGIGMLIGLVPGSSASVSSLISYSVEKKVAKDPSRFGKGAIEGVAGPETANNAYSGAALIPLFTLGIPSSPTVAIILGAFIMHGLTPGPALYQKNPEFIYGVIASMFIGNLILLIMNLPLAGLWAKVALIPYKLLYPLILIISMLGIYSIDRSFWHLGMLIFFGIIGYLMKKLEFPAAAMVLSFILGERVEFTFMQSLAISENGLLIFFQRPISATLIVLCAIILIAGIISTIKNKRDMLSIDAEM